jgi:1-acylglycerone phosphate reductase
MTKYALITGCSEGGIGDAIAIEFHKKGIEVIATARDPTKMEHLKVMGFHTVKLDVVSQESIDAAVKEVEKITGGRLDFLVNNSGLGTQRAFLHFPIPIPLLVVFDNDWIHPEYS